MAGTCPKSTFCHFWTIFVGISLRVTLFLDKSTWILNFLGGLWKIMIRWTSLQIFRKFNGANMPKNRFFVILNHFRRYFLAFDLISPKLAHSPQFSWWFLKENDKINVPAKFQKISMVGTCQKSTFVIFEQFPSVFPCVWLYISKISKAQNSLAIKILRFDCQLT